MERRIFSVILLSMALFCTSAHAKAFGKTDPVEVDDGGVKNEYTNLVISIDDVGAPVVKNNRIIFTAENNARYVGIAFDFENFRTIHSFQLRKIKDAEYETQKSFYFYILDLPKDVQSVEYRLVVDGLWTTDPLNPNVVHNEKSGLF